MTVKPWMLGIVALVGLLTATPAMAASFCGDRLDAGGPLGGGSLLTIVGLTAEQQLVSFQECFPRRLNQIGRCPGCLARTPAWSASISGSRTGDSMGLAMAGASTY